MTVESILVAMKELDKGDLLSIKRAAVERISEIEKAAWQATVDAAWKRAQHWRVGDTLYVCAEGTFMGGPLQRGDKIIVTFIQPRKRMLWAKRPGKKDHELGFPAKEIARYNLSPNKPAKPLPKEERKAVEDISKRLAEVNL